MCIMGSQKGVEDNINKGNILGIEILPLSASLKQSQKMDLVFHVVFTSKTQNQIPAGGLVTLSVTVTHPLRTQVFLCLWKRAYLPNPNYMAGT